MSSLNLDDTTVSKLLNEESVTVCNSKGIPIGTFTRLREAFGPQISEEELNRRMADTTSPRYTTAQVLERLKQLEKDNP